MKARAAAMICLSVAFCAGTPDYECVTSCGLRFEGLPQGWTCENAQEIEDSALSAFKNAADKRLHSCGTLKRYVVEVNPKASFESWGRTVAGQTDCETHRSIIGTTPYKQSALPHEMAHMLQECEPIGPLNEKDYYHSNWERDGINAALKAVFP